MRNAMPRCKPKTIGRKHFTSKKACLAWVRELIHADATAEYQPELLEMVASYDKTQTCLDSNLDTHVERVYAAPPGEAHSYEKRSCLHVVLSNGVEFTVGYEKVVTAAYDPTAAALMRLNQVGFYNEHAR